MLALELVDELPAPAGAAPQVVRLVDDDQVIGNALDALGVLRRFRGVDRGDDALAAFPGLGAVAPELGILEGREGNRELVEHLIAPLAHQRWGREHQDTTRQSPDRVLLEHQAGLDRLAETDLVAQQRPTSHGPHHLAGGVELERVVIDAPQQRRAQQDFEAAEQREPLRRLVEPVVLGRVVVPLVETLEEPAVFRLELERRGRRQVARQQSGVGIGGARPWSLAGRERRGPSGCAASGAGAFGLATGRGLARRPLGGRIPEMRARLPDGPEIRGCQGASRLFEESRQGQERLGIRPARLPKREGHARADRPPQLRRASIATEGVLALPAQLAASLLRFRKLQPALVVETQAGEPRGFTNEGLAVGQIRFEPLGRTHALQGLDLAPGVLEEPLGQ